MILTPESITRRKTSDHRTRWSASRCCIYQDHRARGSNAAAHMISCHLIPVGGRCKQTGTRRYAIICCSEGQNKNSKRWNGHLKFLPTAVRSHYTELTICTNVTNVSSLDFFLHIWKPHISRLSWKALVPPKMELSDHRGSESRGETGPKRLSQASSVLETFQSIQSARLFYKPLHNFLCIFNIFQSISSSTRNAAVLTLFTFSSDMVRCAAS